MKAKKTRKYILCKFKSEYDETMIFYKDGTFRFQGEKDCTSEWKIIHSELGSMLFYKTNNDPDEEPYWQTDWNSINDEEVKLANTITKALVDLAIDNILKGKNEQG